MRSQRFFVTLVLAMGLSAGQTAAGCTMIMAAKNGLVLAGNNEDWRDPKTRVTFIPASEKECGRILFGFNTSPVQGGMNDQGLFIDANAVSPTGWKPDPQKLTYPGNPMMGVLSQCATVEEAQAFFERYNISALDRARFPIADRTGASIVVEYARGKVQFVKKTGWYQISTNFIITDYPDGQYPCNRYRVAGRMLGEAQALTVALVRAILSATHAEGQYPTQYSNIYDLKNGLVYVYYFHNFEEVVTFNLAEELKKGQRSVDLPSLFKVQPHAAKVFEEQQPIPAHDILLELVKAKGLEKARTTLTPGESTTAWVGLTGTLPFFSGRRGPNRGDGPFLEALLPLCRECIVLDIRSDLMPTTEVVLPAKGGKIIS